MYVNSSDWLILLIIFNQFLIKFETPVFNLRCTRVVFCPDPNELVEMVRAKNGGIPGQVVKVVHDDSDEKIEHLESIQQSFCISSILLF